MSNKKRKQSDKLDVLTNSVILQPNSFQFGIFWNLTCIFKLSPQTPNRVTFNIFLHILGFQPNDIASLNATPVTYKNRKYCAEIWPKRI